MTLLVFESSAYSPFSGGGESKAGAARTAAAALDQRDCAAGGTTTNLLIRVRVQSCRLRRRVCRFLRSPFCACCRRCRRWTRTTLSRAVIGSMASASNMACSSSAAASRAAGIFLPHHVSLQPRGHTAIAQIFGNRLPLRAGRRRAVVVHRHLKGWAAVVTASRARCAVCGLELAATAVGCPFWSSWPCSSV